MRFGAEQCNMTLILTGRTEQKTRNVEDKDKIKRASHLYLICIKNSEKTQLRFVYNY